jgi:hypothetical protein
MDEFVNVLKAAGAGANKAEPIPADDFIWMLKRIDDRIVRPSRGHEVSSCFIFHVDRSNHLTFRRRRTAIYRAIATRCSRCNSYAYLPLSSLNRSATRRMRS